MRTLKSTDLFAALRVVREVGVKEEIKRMAAVIQGERVTAQMQTEVGTELLMGILANCGTPKAEQAFYEFLSAPMEIPVDDLKNMDLDEFADKIVELVELVDIDHWRGFFTSLGRLIQKQS